MLVILIYLKISGGCESLQNPIDLASHLNRLRERERLFLRREDKDT